MWLSPGGEKLPEKSTTTFTLPFTGIEVTLHLQDFFGLGVVYGALIAGVSLQLIGRRSSMALYDVLLTYTLAIHVWPGQASRLAMWNRMFMGIAVGALSAIIPIYVCEMSHHKLKNKLMLLLPVFVAVGASCGRAIGSAEYEAPLRSHVFGNVAQYVPLFACFCGCWATAHAFASCLIPESPHYLLGGTCWDDPDDGRVSYTMLRRERFDGGPTKRSSVSEQIRLPWNPFCAPGILSDGKNRKALLTGIGYMFVNQVCGINISVPFMSRVLEMTGSCVRLQTLRSSLSIDVIQVIMAIIAMTIIDKVGRKLLLIFSVMLMSVSSGGLVVCFVLMKLKIDIPDSLDWLPLCLIGIYICAYSIGLSPMAWVVTSEIFSIQVRPYGMSITTAAHWMSVYFILYVRDGVFNAVKVDNFLISIYALGLLLALFFEFFTPKMHVGSLKI
ncbi:facilitated trehalose transporter Tret1-like isoform X2 [Sipha flava]|uniref:Facilitated trehalose transporter Tret1-like isoform X2 n=1 Tax=Sipha flava TaxID=143950 RepID=A0A8B8GN28_9HEMI|nr:facilitated trehalose transporter Tret1-like isoform X2 [Sipha flava]